MGELFNIYCDESCHLENDRQPIMVLGAVWCPRVKVVEISRRLREIKARHNLKRGFETKWNKVSAAKVQFYLDCVDYFFDDDDLHFRGYVIDKQGLNHAAWGQDHDLWYYKMCFRMLEPLIDPSKQYAIYLDIKDTQSERQREKLEEVLRTWRRDGTGQIIQRVQQIRSHESEILQLADLLLGAVGYKARKLAANAGKQQAIHRIIARSGKTLAHDTWLREAKFNLFFWSAQAKGAMA